MKAFLLFEIWGMKNDKICPRGIVLTNSKEELVKLFNGSIVDPVSTESRSRPLCNPDLKDEELHFPEDSVPEGWPEGVGHHDTEKKIRILYIRELPFVQTPEAPERPGEGTGA